MLRRWKRWGPKTPKVGPLNRALVVLSYKTGIPYSVLLMEEDEIIEQYLEILSAEAEAAQRRK